LNENTIHHLELLYWHECDLGVNHHLWCFAQLYNASPFTLLKKVAVPEIAGTATLPKGYTLETPVS
jgi:hypothetical protein